MKSALSVPVTFLAFRTAMGQVSGTPFGFASATTGGGSAEPAAPADIDELVSWLADSTPRVILIDKEFDFIGSEGTTTGHACRGIDRCGADAGGQDTIKDTCDDNEEGIEATWDNAARSLIEIASDKSIVGVGDAGVIRGKGLSVSGGASNVIIQNIHITELNPQFVWGGDALSLDGADNVWIDHNKFSLAGRQFLVSGFNPSGRVTISNNEFDGRTEWSTACNGKHNWGVMLVGSDEEYTFAGNYLHDLSSRGPKLGQTVTEGTNQHFLHGYNNLFEEVSGHSFDIDTNTDILLEGNVFINVNTPITSGSETNGGSIFTVPDSGAAQTCSTYLGRDCVENSLSGSGSWPSLTATGPLEWAEGTIEFIPEPSAVGDVEAFVRGNAGVGHV